MSYYHGLISSKKANSILNERGSDACFLIRDSQSQPGCFVLSAKSGVKVYHVLIFHSGGEYSLDITGGAGSDSEEEEDGTRTFNSLDDLVVFCMSHQLRMDGDVVHLKQVIHCSDTPGGENDFLNEINGTLGKEDSDLLTDLLSSLFGQECSIVSVCRSPLNLDGQPLEEGARRLVILLRDRAQKSFFIKIIDPKEREVVGEKKVTKTFQYDTPGELVITFLSEDHTERDRFCHQLDRVVRLQEEKAAERQRARKESNGASPAAAVPGPMELTHKIKAADFDINHVSPEWQYLFDMAGVTRPMIEERSTLQFILDTVHKTGGAPRNLEQIQDEALQSNSLDPSREGAPPKQMSSNLQQDRMKVLAVEHALRRETQRASQLAFELQRMSIKKESPVPLLSPGCIYKSHCESFKDHLMVRHTLVAIGPEKGSCFCQQCVAGRPIVQVSGSPPQQYTLPLGWCRFVHRSQTHVLAQQFYCRWHVAYCAVPCSRVAGVMRTGQLPTSHSTGNVALSPDIQTACRINPITPMSYEDDFSKQHFKVRTAFQVYVQPGSYSVEALSEESGSAGQTQLAWRAPDRTYIVHALLLQMIPVTPVN